MVVVQVDESGPVGSVGAKVTDPPFEGPHWTHAGVSRGAVCDRLAFVSVLLVSKVKCDGVGRDTRACIIQRVLGGEAFGVAMVEGYGIESKWGTSFRLGCAELARAEEVVEGNDSQVLDGPPTVAAVALGRRHFVEVDEHGDSDRPLSPRRRIISGESTEGFLDFSWQDEFAKLEGVRSHHVGDFLAHGTECLRNGRRSDRLVGTPRGRLVGEVAVPVEPDVDLDPLDDGTWLEPRAGVGDATVGMGTEGPPVLKGRGALGARGLVNGAVRGCFRNALSSEV